MKKSKLSERNKHRICKMILSGKTIMDICRLHPLKWAEINDFIDELRRKTRDDRYRHRYENGHTDIISGKYPRSKRCPICGANTVIWPCLVCNRKQVKRIMTELEQGSLGIDLKGDAYKRYLEIYERKRRNGNLHHDTADDFGIP